MFHRRRILPMLAGSSLIAALTLPPAADARILRVPAAYPTIAAAMAVAFPGDIVQVSCGNYVEHGIEMKSGATLRSETGDPACVVIDGGGVGRILRCSGVSSATRIEGLTFRNGYTTGSNPAQYGAGVLCISGAAPTIASCVFDANVASEAGYGRGGGLGIYQSSPIVQGTVFQGNGADQGGGAICQQSSASFEGCLFVDNAVPSQGGGMWADGSSVTITGCEFIGNGIPIYGGGLAFSLVSQPVVTNCTFRDNTGFYGGALSCRYGASPVVTNCTFEENHGRDEVAVGVAGGVFTGHSGTSPRITDCRFLRNEASGGGGAFATSGSSPRFERCLFAGNSSRTGGDAARCQDQSAVVFSACTFVENYGVVAGATIVSYDSSPDFAMCSFAFGGSPWVFSCGGSGAPQLTCCDLYGNAGGDFVLCAEGQEGINGNFSADPRFCDLEGENYGLDAMSPCLPGRHPDGYDCGLIGAYGEGCGVATAVPEGAREPASWGVVKQRFQ